MNKVLQHQRILPFVAKSMQLKPSKSNQCYIHLTATSSVFYDNPPSITTSTNNSSNILSFHSKCSFQKPGIFLNQFPQRFLSSRSFQNRKKRKGATPLMNEHLIQSLLKKSKKDAESTQVRIVIDKGRGSKPDVEVMSIIEAIKVSGNLEVDLIAINMEQDLPVIKAIKCSKFLYEESKKKSGATKVKQTKQFSFKAGIADNDLERKAGNLASYLKKGHACQVTITSNYRNLKADSNTMTTTLDRLRNVVGDIGKEQGNMIVNEWGNRGSLLFQPNSKK